MPVTAATFIVGWLAIAGVPPFAGFWSKDEILLFTLADSPALYVIGLVTAVLTAYYMTRQVVMVFFGEAKWESYANADEAPEGEEDFASTAHGEFKPHESPPIMLFPLVVLAGLALVGGLMQLPSFGFIPSAARHRLEDFLHPVIEFAEADIKDTAAYDAKLLLAVLAIVCAMAGIIAAIAIYGRQKAKPFEPEILADGWGYDRAITNFMGGPGRRMFDAVAWFDQHVIDGAVNGVAAGISRSAAVLRRGQTGNVRNYAGIIGIGVVLLLAWFVIARGVM
jgi:NADH-quinone oxidoreductase subunit L